MPDLNGPVPILSSIKKAKVGAQVAALPRSLDALGMMDGEVINGPQGPQPRLSRDQYMDADQLLEAMRQIVREEISAYFRKEQSPEDALADAFNVVAEAGKKLNADL